MSKANFRLLLNETMNKHYLYLVIFFGLVPFFCFAQRQTLTSQGGLYVTDSKLTVSQSIGQTSVIGNFSNSESGIVQGYQQPFWDQLTTNTWNKLDLSLSPNPFENIFSILFKDDKRMTLSLYDITGRLVFSKDIDFKAPSTPVEIDGLAVATYLALIHVEGEKYFTKLIKE